MSGLRGENIPFHLNPFHTHKITQDFLPGFRVTTYKKSLVDYFTEVY